MSFVKSLSVGNGDMFYIRHGSDNFTVVDCCLSDDNRERIVDELLEERRSGDVTRFVSTHPDEDHIQGIKYLDKRMSIRNFYCVENSATKKDETESFTHYCSLRDGEKAFYVERGCKRRWMNQKNSERGSSGINVLWPDHANSEFKAALQDAADGLAFNNMSIVVTYSAHNDAKIMWLGDLETEFMEAIEDDIDLSLTHIIFAPHHGRSSGKIPDSWLDRLKPKIIVIGEAPSRQLHYYTGYNTLTQNRAGDLTFDCVDKDKIHIYASERSYKVSYLSSEDQSKYSYYIGTLNL